MDKKIYLVRHGKVIGSEEKKYLGNTDLSLSNDGIYEVYALKEFFSSIDIEKAYTSTLKRCIQTTEIILADRNVEKNYVEEFREINLGEWDGKSFEYIKKVYPQQYEERGRYLDTFIPPGGESFIQLQDRVMLKFDQIRTSAERNVLIVAHAGVNRVILGKLLGVPLNQVLNIKQPYGCINELFWDETLQKWQLEQF